MTEEKKHMINEIMNEKQPLWMTVAKAIVICLVVVLIVLGAFIAFLQISIFEQVQKHTSVAEYKAEVIDSLTYDSNGFMVKIPEEVIGSVIETQVKGELELSESELVNLYYDGLDHRAYMNISYKGFYLPISFALEFKQLNDTITVSYEEMMLSRHDWSLRASISDYISKSIGFPKSIYIIDNDEVGINKNLSLKEMTFDESGMILNFGIDTTRIIEEVSKVRTTIDPILLDHYKAFSGERTVSVLDIIENGLPLTEAQVQLLVNDFLGNQFVINDILLLTNGYDSSGLDQLMKDFNGVIDTRRIDMERKAFKGQAVDPQIAKIFIALDTHFSERIMAFNHGKPFDIDSMTTMTIKELVDHYSIEIEEGMVDKMTFIYDEAFKVAYLIDDYTYYIRGLDGYDVVDVSTYEAMLGAGIFVKPDYVTDRQLWDEVVNYAVDYFETEEIFVRYMKSDGLSIFAVLSTYEEPQKYWSMALMTGDEGLVLLEENVKNVALLIENHREFNVETVAKGIMTADFEHLDQAIQSFIIEELYEQRKIPNKRDTTIIYSAYDGEKYIVFKLSNGDEYVYKVDVTVYGTYLATLYTKAKAMRNWPDVSELLLLQDPPE